MITSLEGWANAPAIAESNLQSKLKARPVRLWTRELRTGVVIRPSQSRTPIKRIAIALVVLLCVAAAGAVLLHHFWPFTKSYVRARLGEAAAATVRFGSFHEKYFPPGCIMENVVFQHGNSGPPLISIRRLTISSNIVGLMHHHISLLLAEGIHVTL
ncbi:MAG TPA: hypothetical protein VHQ22_09195, partial [Terriglobales bacterium]|nr:hypothetical protein [Terriglobales bacterium]